MVRRILGGLAALAFVAAASVWSVTHAATVRAAAEAKADDEARLALDKAVAALEAEAEKVALQAKSGAEARGIVALVETPDSMSDPAGLEATIRDLRSTEDWFKMYAETGAVALLYGGRALFITQSEHAGAMTALAADAVRLGTAARLGHAKGEVWLFGAARVPVNTTADRAVFGLATPVTADMLGAAAAQVGGAVGARARGGAWVLGGNDADAQLIGRSASAKNTSHCCASREIADGLELVVARDPRAIHAAADAETSRARVPALLAAVVLAALALVIGFRKPALPHDEQPPAGDVAARLEQTQAELQRLSQRAVQPGTTVRALNAEASKTGGFADVGLESTKASIAPSRYEVVAPLGEGGMARVAVAVLRGAEGFKRYFVLKRLRPELTGTREIVDQFIDEARMGASLVHSNIVPVFDFGRDADGYYLAQEYILGRDVGVLVRASKAKRGRALEVPIVLAIAHEALKALSYAHAKTSDAGRPLALVHRDVSPNNLIVSARGEVKLLDFGIVKSEDRVTQTQTGMVKGNLFFMAPEQAKALAVDARADLFSLGLVLVFALLGEPLYDGATSYELIMRAGLGLTDADRARICALGAPVAGVLLRALATDRDSRPASADELSRALAAVGHAATAADLTQLVNELFGGELEAERARVFGEQA